MKTRWGLLLWLILPVILLACSDNSDTRLSFDNQAECGTATITLTHTGTGNIQEHSLAQGERLDVKVDHDQMVELDGDIIGEARHIQIEVQPRALIVRTENGRSTAA